MAKKQGPTEQEIAEAAYHRYLKRGGQSGSDFDDWIEAERELAAQVGAAATDAPPAAAPKAKAQSPRPRTQPNPKAQSPKPKGSRSKAP
jgi:hypothetical protein